MAKPGKSAARKDCPCGSGAPYADCCGPFHRGEREAPTAALLMRSRYSAFALGDAEYLLRTLHADHDDRARPRDEVLRSLRATSQTLRFMGLAVLDHRERGGSAQVLFHARVFEKGQERSFVELSDFLRDAEGWRYLAGVLVPASKLGEAIQGLTIDAFEALAS
jgi:SEC-C motif-containing protein